jgi:two-component system, cell cycle response regulator
MLVKSNESENMHTNTSASMSIKPRILIADDSRIVRATLIKRIEGMFEFREALNGEQAWEMLLIDPNIRVVITDLTMPLLDGYGLLKRIRSSKISRISNIPVVVVSGSDEEQERTRAKAAGATDLISKGIGTAQLLSRLDILSKLVNTQREFERSLEVLLQNTTDEPGVVLSSPEMLETQAELVFSNAIRHKKNFVILNVCVGLKHKDLNGATTFPPISVVDAIGQLLQRTIRQTDKVAQTGDAEFTLVTGSINFDSARNFAQRICRAIVKVNVIEDDQMTFIASCGMAPLADSITDTNKNFEGVTFHSLREIAHRRASLGLFHAVSGVVGEEEENSFGLAHDVLPVSLEQPEYAVQDKPFAIDEKDKALMEPGLKILLQWMKEGRQDQVRQHIKQFSTELEPLMELMQQQIQ